MTDTADAQLQLKKRARRRLVGAFAFAGLAAIVLPMVMDEEPKAPANDVQIRIPSLDQTPYDPTRLAANAPPAAPATGASAVDTRAAVPVAPADANGKVAPVAAPPADKAVAKAPEKPAEKSPEKPADKPADKASDKAPSRDVAKETPKEPVKEAAKPPAKELAKESSKESSKESAKDNAKDAAKASAAKAADKSAEAAKTAEESRRAAAILGGKPAAAPASDAAHVILIGAFANPGNVKQLQSKLNELSIKTYTEPLESPQGTKTRLRAGPFPSREAAEKALDRMKRIGVSGVVAAKQ
ncbi:hypothetical protein HCX48_01870 [Rhodocyclus tenuis]|uniref:SPOR domain-containing protein n=2 Tax=Rhodocyclus TaxID=1064 RepID=A0A6L5JWA6_RHOTE|nr:SPOR domain-containing protein [Rhodocyclus gracilis]MQY50468.1 hypothetical protein [Rhodocyclus gracilis]NJA87971.1 hypothetical protein [Rhodocyclus gracilis]